MATILLSLQWKENPVMAKHGPGIFASDESTGQVKVKLEVFGRPTLVELERSQIEIGS